MRIIGPPPKPPAEEARLTGRRHSLERDASAIGHHYDVGNEFYRIVLGESMTYTSAYWAHSPSSGFSLDQAQMAKCDLIAGKLGLQEGMRLLDVGCRWGTFALHAARTYGARVVGVTLSREQADYATKRAAEQGPIRPRADPTAGLPIRPRRPLRRHFQHRYGRARRRGDAARLRRGPLHIARPQVGLLNSAISRRPGPRGHRSRTPFIERYVFAGGELEPLATMLDALESAGFEVRDVESLRALRP